MYIANLAVLCEQSSDPAWPRQPSASRSSKFAINGFGSFLGYELLLATGLYHDGFLLSFSPQQKAVSIVEETLNSTWQKSIPQGVMVMTERMARVNCIKDPLTGFAEHPYQNSVGADKYATSEAELSSRNDMPVFASATALLAACEAVLPSRAL